MFVYFFLSFLVNSAFPTNIDLQNTNQVHKVFENSTNDQSLGRIITMDKYEPAREFLKHYNSLNPIAVLVDDTQQSRDSARQFLESVFKIASDGVKRIRFFISKFNTTGISPLLNFTENAANQIDDFLSEKVAMGKATIGIERFEKGSLAIYAILKTCAILPPGSAILLFIDRKIADPDLAVHAQILKQRNIKLYVVIGGHNLLNTKRLLNEMSGYSGGLFLPYNRKDLSAYNYGLFLENEHRSNISAILYKYNLIGETVSTFPVDSAVTAVNVIITPSVRQASIKLPNDDVIDITNDEEVAKYGTMSFGMTNSDTYLKSREVYFDAQFTPNIGLWRLTINNDNTQAYNVSVFVFSNLVARVHVFRRPDSVIKAEDKEVIRVGISASYVTSISNITVITENETTISNIDFNFKKNSGLVLENSKTEKQLDVELMKNIPQKSFQVLVQGNDSKGNQFSRIAYFNDYSSNSIFPKQTVLIDVALGSELITTGGRNPVIIFEVTNYKSNAVDIRFYCSDDKAILQSMTPYRTVLNPLETTTVRVTLTTRSGTYQDTITLSASLGSESIEKKAIVDVGLQVGTTDMTPPDLDYSYLSDCSKVLFSGCDQGSWTLEVKAKDRDSGLLQVTTLPKGIHFSNGFTTGTKEEIVGTYGDSCCNPDLQITAIDRMNNRRDLTANAYRASWGPGQIAALALGILLLIILIIVIVYFVRKCIKKRQKFHLPIYKAGRM